MNRRFQDQARPGIGEDFDGYFAVELGVGASIDCAHSSFAEFRSDSVVGDEGWLGHFDAYSRACPVSRFFHRRRTRY